MPPLSSEISGSGPIGAMPAKSVNRPGSSKDFAAMLSSFGDEVLLTGSKRDALSANSQRAATVDDNHIFVTVVNVFGGSRVLIAGPESHLTAIYTVEDVTFNAWSRLV